jgi:quinol-cytochrome oxidoreductase complex cytochrome b subunit
MIILVYNGVILTENCMKFLVMKLGDTFCAILGFMVNFIPEMSAWIIVAISGIRFVAVVFPLKAASWISFKAAKVYLAVTTSVFSLFAFPDLLYSRVPPEDEGLAYSCDMLVSGDIYAGYELSHTLVSIVIPFIILVLLNLTIVYKLNARQKDMEGVKEDKCSKEDRNVMLMVMAVTVAFIVLLLPFLLFVVFFDFYDVEMTSYETKQWNLSYVVTVMLISVNSSINFYLYFIVCKKFRADFKTLLLCRHL